MLQDVEEGRMYTDLQTTAIQVGLGDIILLTLHQLHLDTCNIGIVCCKRSIVPVVTWWQNCFLELR